MKVLLSKANDANPSVSAKSIAAIGELSQVGCERMLPYLGEVMPLLLAFLQDQSSILKREYAMKTLGQFCGNTGVVITPYFDYPKLLDVVLGVLKTEQTPSIRLETIKVLGILGAVDPYAQQVVAGDKHISDSEEVISTISTLDDGYYPSVVLHSLSKIMNESSLSTYHMAAVQALVHIFESLRHEFVPFLSQIMPSFMQMMRTCAPSMLEFNFTKLRDMVHIMKVYTRGYLPDIMDTINIFWTSESNLQLPILALIEELCFALESEFNDIFPLFLPKIMLIFDADVSTNMSWTQKALHSFTVFGSLLDAYLNLIVPAILGIFERENVSLVLRKYSVQVMGQIAKTTNISPHSSKVIHSILRILNGSEMHYFQEVCFDTIIVLAKRLKLDFFVFIAPIHQIMMKKRIKNEKFELIAAYILKNEIIPPNLLKYDEEITQLDRSDEKVESKVRINEIHLQRSWDASDKSTPEDWVEWIRRLNVELLKESPSQSLRSCANLAALYNSFARELFNSAFFSCWVELFDTSKEDLIKALQAAITAPNIPLDILQTLLNLVEFMDHENKPLPLDIRMLSQNAARCHAWAKALHYKENEYLKNPKIESAGSLININNKLDQIDAAVGILVATERSNPSNSVSSWYEKLNRWDDALEGYRRKQDENPRSIDALFGQMRCLQNLGEWDRLSSLSQERFDTTEDESLRKNMAPIAAAAAWSVENWSFMQKCVDLIKVESPDGSFFRAVLKLHENEFPEALYLIQKARQLLDTELTALIAESYNRAYPIVVRVQMLAELEEVILYKKSKSSVERQALIRKTWMTRLEGCEHTVDIWQKILRVHALVVSPLDGPELYIKFANLCRKSGKVALSLKILSKLLHSSSTNDIASLDVSANPPQVTYACLKHAWSCGIARQTTLKQMRQFTTYLAGKLRISSLDMIEYDQLVVNEESKALLKLLARGYLKLGEWQWALEGGMNANILSDVLQSYLAATKCDKTWYKAWYQWALSNFKALNAQEQNGIDESSTLLVISAIQGFFQSVALSKENSLQDTLRLLTLWFKYGHFENVNTCVAEGIRTIVIDNWLQVIPQLIARIQIQNANIHEVLHELLADVGRAHPQALVWSVIVASQSQNVLRKGAATSIIDKMRSHDNILVEEVLMVSQELLRVAVSWPEMWHDYLEDASKFYYKNHDIRGMLEVLEPIHNLLEKGPETQQEKLFVYAFGDELREAWAYCNRYRLTDSEDELKFAWDIYLVVFSKIATQLSRMKSLELEIVSPRLFSVRSLELAIPGTYKSTKDIVKIESMKSNLNILNTKQRPRIMALYGSDGKEHQFLLKGHEDLRQDERVMQLFSLVNSLLLNDAETFKRHLDIKRFSVIPLSPNAGLIGWVPNTDTFNNLITEYRESRKILLNIEHKLMLQLSGNYDTLCLLQKVEIFNEVLSTTSGQDLFKILWLKSKNSEVWLERRTNYARSLAVMSMVGYIMGLGDRHPANLMLERFTGKVVHIDFGDCFETAMRRENYPEKVPFRLTRLFVNAMGVSGVEGNFRLACEHVMRVLRENKVSLMAVLEAFVYDPVINWRLVSEPTFEDDIRSPVLNSTELFLMEGINGGRRLQEESVSEVDSELLNSKSMIAINRISDKLRGKDFKTAEPLDIPSQVQRLIEEASLSENLCQAW
ncbi:phosphatidylinositol kinase- protein kinase tor1, partial [Physocladia obscura]